MPAIELHRFKPDTGVWQCTEHVYLPSYLAEEPRARSINQARMWLDSYIRKFDWRYDHCFSADKDVLGYPFYRPADPYDEEKEILADAQKIIDEVRASA